MGEGWGSKKKTAQHLRHNTMGSEPQSQWAGDGAGSPPDGAGSPAPSPPRTPQTLRTLHVPTMASCTRSLSPSCSIIFFSAPRSLSTAALPPACAMAASSRPESSCAQWGRRNGAGLVGRWESHGQHCTQHAGALCTARGGRVQAESLWEAHSKAAQVGAHGGRRTLGQALMQRHTGHTEKHTDTYRYTLQIKRHRKRHRHRQRYRHRHRHRHTIRTGRQKQSRSHHQGLEAAHERRHGRLRPPKRAHRGPVQGPPRHVRLPHASHQPPGRRGTPTAPGPPGFWGFRIYIFRVLGSSNSPPPPHLDLQGRLLGLHHDRVRLDHHRQRRIAAQLVQRLWRHGWHI
jgi:hypothetical protein